MTIQRKTLVESLKKVMPGIENVNTVLQGSDAFIFYQGRLFSSSNKVSVNVPLDLDEELEGAIHANEFFKVINKMKGDEIDIEVNEKSWKIKCNKAKMEIALLDFDYEKRLSNINPTDEWLDIDDDILSAIASCDITNNKSEYSGIHFKDNIVISTDGFQMNEYHLKYNVPDLWISDESAKELLKLKDFKGIQVNDNWVHFKTENDTVFSIRAMNTNNFPFARCKNLLDSSTFTDDDLHAEFPKELFNVIDTANSFDMIASNRIVIKLTLSKDGIEVYSENSVGCYSEKINWTEDTKLNDFEPISFYVDYAMMNVMRNKVLSFYLLPGNKSPRLLFVSPDSKHLMVTFAND